MRELQFFEGKLPSAYRYNFEPYLFNREEYRLLQSASQWLSFYLLNEHDLLVEGHLHFYVKDDSAHSIIQSPFGGIEYSERVDRKTLFHFIEFVCENLKARGTKNIRIVNPPHAYAPVTLTLTETFLYNQGFEVSTAEIGSVISVTNKPFLDILHARKRRKLTQSLQSSLTFKVLDSTLLDQVYSFIESQRKEKSYQLSISRDHLARSVKTLNDAYVLFGVFDEDKLVAASVAVRVSQTILYHFISDHIRKIGDAKPALILMNGIYNFCLENNITLLDLGTSAKGSQPNFKLIKFKTEIGGQLTHKHTFTKKLA